jgi:hypothetical protein
MGGYGKHRDGLCLRHTARHFCISGIHSRRCGPVGAFSPSNWLQVRTPLSLR